MKFLKFIIKITGLLRVNMYSMFSNISSCIPSDETMKRMASLLSTASIARLRKSVEVGFREGSSSRCPELKLGGNQAHESLTEMDLSGLGVDYRDIANLVCVLKDNPPLQALRLNNNKIGDEGAKALAEALADNSTLISLELTNNWIGNDGANALTMALQHNISLKKLHLDRNNIEDDGVQGLANALKNNANLELLVLEDNNVRERGTIAINEIATALDPANIESRRKRKRTWMEEEDVRPSKTARH